MNFSVLISVYKKENPFFFERAMQSIWHDQTLKPTEIVLVKDGPLTSDLNKVIAKWQNEIGGSLNVITLEKNVGLGKALNIGIVACQFDLIARMDTDDISLKKLFEIQISTFKTKNIDICGSWVNEFTDQESKTISQRRLPETHLEILKFSKKRSPMNHPSVMFKKKSVLKVGSYASYYFSQDYHLWVKMLMAGQVFYNIQEPLLNMRIGKGQLQRRHGFNYARNEFRIQKQFLDMKFLNPYEFARNVIIRFVARNVPIKILKLIYTRLRNL